jgi:hypothetical protein
MMKTMKYILLIICVSLTTSLLAANLAVHEAASVPNATFRSTSTMSLSGSTLPCAAMELTIGEEMPNAGSSTPRGPQRVSPNQPPEDPMENPLGDVMLPLLLLAAGYGIYLRRKNSVRTSDSGHQQ